MSKITLQGISVPAVVGAITAIFMAVFHKSLNPAIIAFLPFAVTTIAGYFGINFASAKAAAQAVAAVMLAQAAENVPENKPAA